MKTMRTIAVILAFGLIFGNIALAQAKDADKTKETLDKVKQEIQLAYDQAKKAISLKDWKTAIEACQKIAAENGKSGYYGESLYWLGYSMDRFANSFEDMKLQLKNKEMAIEELNVLLQKMPESTWARDAKLLRLEIAEGLANKGLSEYQKYINEGLAGGVSGGVAGSGWNQKKTDADTKLYWNSNQKKIDPDTELKLVALDALMQMDREKAFPILEKMVREEQKPELKEKALFVLSQSRDPKVIPILAELAAKDPSDKIRQTAVFWLGQRHDDESLAALLKIYDAAADDDKLIENLIM